MDLVAAHRRVGEGEATADPSQLLVHRERRLEIEQVEPGARARLALDAVGIVDSAPQHLQTAADAHHPAAVAQMALQGRAPTALAQPLQVAASVLRARQDDEVGWRDRVGGADVAKVDARMQPQRVEVGVIADPRNRRDDHAQRVDRVIRGDRRCARQPVLGLQVQSLDEGQYPECRSARTLAQHVEARLQQRGVAAEAVDDEAARTGAFGRGQQLERADELGEHAAALDVAHQEHRAVDRLGETHVGDVVLAQVDLGRTAGPLDQDHVVVGGEARVRGEGGLARDALVLVISARIEVRNRASVDDDLRVALAGGLEEYRVHVGHGIDAGGRRLRRLRPPDLAAIGRDRAVERHVLGLEGGDAHAPPCQHAAQTGHHRALAGIGGRALDHQGRGVHDGRFGGGRAIVNGVRPAG